MFEEIDEDEENTRARRPKSTRASTPRPSRPASSTRRKTTSSNVGGKHQRRNKHWNW